MVVVYWSWNCESCPEIKYFSLFLRTALLFQLIPARGRKPYQKDGFDDVRAFQLIPARGRKHTIIRNHDELIRISTYPRKGTETMETILIPIVIPFQLIPARGRKHGLCGNLYELRIRFQLIPARGRKLNCLRTTYIKLRISTYPRKNPLRRCAPALPKGELL